MSDSGIFTTIKVKNSMPLFWDRHQKRLQTHIAQGGFPPLSPKTSLEQMVKTYIKKNTLSNCALKIIIRNENGQSLISLESRPLPPTDISVKAITFEDTRDASRTIKTVTRLVNEEANKFAKEQNADAALFVQNGNLIEATNANIFSLNENNTIITPAVEGKGLKGITREILMEHTSVLESDIAKQTTGPLVLTSCLRLQKVSHLDGRKLSDPEELFQRIKEILEKAENEYILSSRPKR
jgi:branched-chain amino acid aminotransferase